MSTTQNSTLSKELRTNTIRSRANFRRRLRRRHVNYNLLIDSTYSYLCESLREKSKQGSSRAVFSVTSLLEPMPFGESPTSGIGYAKRVLQSMAFYDGATNLMVYQYIADDIIHKLRKENLRAKITRGGLGQLTLEIEWN